MSAARLLSSSRFRTALFYSTSASIAYFTCQPAITHLESPSHKQWIRPSQDASLIGSGARSQQHVAKSQKAEKNHTKEDDAETIHQANDPDVYAPAFEDDDDGAWAQSSRDFDNLVEGIRRIKWAGMGDRITDYVVPSWAKMLPDAIQKLEFEVSMKPGTLADEIWQEAHDADINPEILWDAKVRVSTDLCADELRFRRKRKEHIVKAFTKYLELDEPVDPEDIPTIAMCGSGGGLRAMVAGTSSFFSTQKAGLFDCVTYTAGVSGSCWLQTLFYSSLGKQNYEVLLNHIKSRIQTHIAFPPPALKLITSAPTNKFILSGFIEKLRGDPNATFGLVDVYSLMLATRLMVPKGDLDVQDGDLKLSNQRSYIENGQFPMPIYTVVRHEIPIVEESKKQQPSDPAQQAEVKEKARRNAWFQWIELHPWEVFCEEFGAGIPTWSLGRPFAGGMNKLVDTGIALPEIRQSLLLGIYGSAFCATLAHYYKEVRPLLTGMAMFSGLDGLIEGKNDDLSLIHPIEPATIPNWVYGMKKSLPSTCPESVFESDHLQVMDAGMSNNLPIYPLLRPGRDVDVLIAFDASAEVKKENWLSGVDGYAKQRGIKSWPVGTGWPLKLATAQENITAYEAAEAKSPAEAAEKLAKARKDGQAQTQLPVKEVSKSPKEDEDLSYCNIWVGTKQERSSDKEPPPSKRLSWDDPDDTTFHLMQPDATMAIIYFPLLPNSKVPGVDPDKTDFLSTWNFVYEPEQVDKVVELARTNFEEGADATKRTIRTVYERKKALRLASEGKQKIKWWKNKLRDDGDSFTGH